MWQCMYLDGEMPILAGQYQKIMADRYALTTAMGRKFGSPIEIMLQSGYIMKITRENYKSIPFDWILDGDEPRLRQFYGRNAEVGSWYSQWKVEKDNNRMRVLHMHREDE